MKILLLGCGAQGKATLYDLIQNRDITDITVVENNYAQAEEFISKLDDKRITLLEVDANDSESVLALLRKHDIVIDLLPSIFRKHVTALAIDAGIDLVNTSFQSSIKEYRNEAKAKGVRIMPEAGLDPGIDLILAGNAISRFDKVEEFYSACGGVPVPEACDNPLNYKVSWTFEGVLSAYKRPADIIIDSNIIKIKGDKIFNHSEEIYVDGIGTFDRYPNGRASTYAKLLGIPDVRNMGRYTLRWPGHSAFWKNIVKLGLIDDDPVQGISPKKYMAKVLAPKLKYKDHEQDMIILRNEITGIKDGKKTQLIQQVVDRRDLKTGFMAMNRTVGFTASIIAQMILENKITGTGILNPGKDVPYDEFINELDKRGIIVAEKES
jgi:saccharopine dehydrogenase-like NADP-dependent oxidoreductase